MTDDEIICEWVEGNGSLSSSRREGILLFARFIIAAERERCAKIVRGLIVDGPTTTELVAGANIALGNAFRKINND